jgi:hypothetical protein
MPPGNPDPNDARFLAGVYFPNDRESLEELAYALCEEYTSVGLAADEILEKFRDPAHAIPHRTLTRLGEAEIRRIANECREICEAAGAIAGLQEEADSAEQAPSARR